MQKESMHSLMHNYRQRGFWIFITLLLCFSSLAGSAQAGVTLSTSPLTLLRQELVDTIKDLQTNGDAGDAYAELVQQLEQLQSVTGKPFQQEWENAGLNLTESRSFCFVVSSFEGLYINSGIGTAYYALAELLARGGNNVTVLYTRDQLPATGSFNDWVKHYRAQGIQLKSLPLSDKRITNPKLQAVSAQVYRYLKHNHYDIVHFADFEGLGFYSTLAKRVGIDFANTLFVVGLHGPTRWVLDANEGRIPSHESELEVDWMERMSVENADVVWTPSNSLASFLSVNGWNLTRGVHLLPLPPGPEVIGMTPSGNVKAKELVFFGRLERRKGLLLFCDAIDLLANMHSHVPKDLVITFLGTRGFIDGHDSMTYILYRARAWPFKLNVITNATREAALKYLTAPNSGRIPVIPSLIDNAPYTVYECLYAGIPFLASATPSITPLLIKYEHHLFDPKPHTLASKMIRVIKDGLSPAKSVFSVDRAENTWFSFYSQMRLGRAIAQPQDLPMVSVCITHFNRPDLVKQALASIENQDYENLEVILVDDGSNNTEAINYLDSLQDSFDAKGWQIIRTENMYLGAARNNAAQKSQGKYLFFLDDDNVAFPHSLSTYVAVAERMNAQIVTAGHAIFKGVATPTIESVDRVWLPLGPSLAVGLYKNCFGDANFFVEKDAFLSIGGFTEEQGVGLEEHEFFAKAVFAGMKLEIIPEPLLFYRMHDEANQMFNLDPRMGEARRIRPYLDALPADQRRPVVTLVARNAMSPNQDCNQTLTAINPSSGPITGGTQVTVTGMGFSCGVQAVKIDGQECTGITVVDNYHITCQTPAGSTTYAPVDVTADVGGSTIALHSAFTYLPLGGAPALNVCRVADDGSSISCTFDSITNQASGSCATFFTADTVASFGVGANCFWVTNVVMEIDLGYEANITISDLISILAGVVSSQGNANATNQATSTPLLPPLDPQQPIASISTSSNVGSCEGISLNASSSTGGLGRALTVTWSLISVVPASSSSQSAITQILQQANLQGSESVSIDAADVAIAAYTFSLTVANWIGLNTTTTTTVTKVPYAVPQVSISGSSVVQIYRNAALTLQGVTTAACNLTLTELAYSWTISPSVGLDSSLLSSATLTVPNNTFIAGTTYTISFTASDASNAQVNNSANITVSVGVRDLIALVTGGNKQYEITDVITLDASGSSDPEGLPNFAYSWTCTSFYDATVPCNISLPSEATLNFNAEAIGAGKYTVTLQVSGALNRTASTSVWIEVVGVSVLSISIQPLTTDPVDPSSSLTLTGVLNQAGVSLDEVTWSWTLVSGTLGNTTTAYLSTLDAIVLVIAPDALSPGGTYTYKLSATQTATGVTGSATISFSVSKAPTTGLFTCLITSGAAEETDFTYEFTKWSSNIVSYEVRFVPSGSLLEIPVAEPSSAANITTKLPYGTYTIVGIATSSSGVSSRQSCTATVTYTDASAGLVSLSTLAAGSGLSSFDVARLAYGAQATDTAVNTNSSATSFDSIRASLLSAVQSAGSSTNSEVTADTATFVVLTDTSLGVLSESALISTIGAFSSLLNSQASATVNTSVYAADLQVLSNLIDQLSRQDFSVKISSKRSVESDDDLWNAFLQVVTMTTTVSSQYLSDVTSGQSQITITQKLLTLYLYAAPTSQLASQGVTMGSGITATLPSGFVPAGVTANTLDVSFSSWGISPFPGSSAVVSPVLMLSVSASGSALEIDSLPSPASIFVPKSELTDTSDLVCVQWSSSNWTSDSCTTQASGSGVTCHCNSVGTYAVIKSAVSRAETGKKGSNGGLDGKWIGVIAGVGGVALIAVVVGSVFAVRRRRNNNARPAAPIHAAAVLAPSSSIPSDAASSSAVPVAIAAAPVALAIDPQTPASSSGSRSFVSSSSSEDEVMEQQIKDIVGELSTALPRDPRALEVLGDNLDME